MNCEAHDATVENLAGNDFNLENLETGHPAKTLHAENVALSAFLDALAEQIAANAVDEICAGFGRLNAIHAHYAKKEFLFMPVLARRGFPHPLTFMWEADDEIKKSVRALAKNLSPENFAARRDKILTAIQNLRDMLGREENVFIPMALKLFTDEDWRAVYRDSLEMAPAFIAEIPRWNAVEIPAAPEPTAFDGKIQFATGELTFSQLAGILKLLPVDITFIDAADTIRFFVNEGKIFDRPRLALGNEIFACHPPQIQPVIRKLLADFKAGTRTSMEVWRPIKGKPVSVQYFAVHDNSGGYIGAVEIVQEHTAALKKFAKG